MGLNNWNPRTLDKTVTEVLFVTTVPGSAAFQRKPRNSRKRCFLLPRLTGERGRFLPETLLFLIFFILLETLWRGRDDIEDLFSLQIRCVIERERLTAMKCL